MTILKTAAVLAISVLAFGAAGVLRAADVCQTISEATRKVIFTPVHIYSTEDGGFRKEPLSSEMIYTGGPNGPVYVFVNSKWRRSPLTAAKLDPGTGEKDPSIKTACRYLRDEAVNGEPAAVYSVHTVTPDFQSDGTIWISKSKNLPLKSVNDKNVGGAAGKSHTATRYDYVNVQPPSGVK